MSKEYVDVHQISEMLENAQIITDGENNGYCTEDVDLALIRREDVEPVVHAHWIPGDVIQRYFIGDAVVSTIYDWWKCSNCGYKVENCNEPKYSYCPHCGARMEEVS